ncbi:hypothetical protein J3F83DRAFT_722051 [Trichoderma novae-zelandiae]
MTDPFPPFFLFLLPLFFFPFKSTYLLIHFVLFTNFLFILCDGTLMKKEKKGKKSRWTKKKVRRNKHMETLFGISLSLRGCADITRICSTCTIPHTPPRLVNPIRTLLYFPARFTCLITQGYRCIMRLIEAGPSSRQSCI